MELEKLNSPPRIEVQFEGIPVPWHPCGETTHVDVEAVDMNTRTVCAGVPTRMANEDHGPSLPSLEDY